MNRFPNNDEDLISRYNYDMWTPEQIYAEWLGVSILVMTVSLLFYHMTKVSSIEMNSKIAGIFSVTLIIISGILNIAAIITYWDRVSYTLSISHKHTKKNNENIYRIVYLTIGVVYSIVQCGISYVIIKGSIQK